MSFIVSSTAKCVGYLRVSTADQDLEKNKSDILWLAHEKELGPVVFIEEQISGRVSWRKRKISDVIDELDYGDSIVVSGS